MNNKNELYKSLWNVANMLRGNMDASEFKNYILGFIFFKYLSENLEKFIKENNINLSEYGVEDLKEVESGITENIGYFFKEKYFYKNIINEFNKNVNILDLLNKAFKEIENSTLGTRSEEDFRGLFDDIDLTSNKIGDSETSRSKKIGDIMIQLNNVKLDYTNEDLLGDAYEFLIGKFASDSGKKGGEFYTPKEVSILLAKIVSTSENEINSVYDPTCGSGSLLIRTYNEIKDKNKNIYKIYGQELNDTTFNLARMNMFLHNIPFDRFEIKQGNTISEDKFRDKFSGRKNPDAIVANPPFGVKWEQKNEYLNEDKRFIEYGVLAPKSRGEMVFIQHMLYHLSNKGIMATVAPNGVLFRGASEEKIRTTFINNNYLDAIIELPANLFFGTSIPVVIMIFKKNRKKDNQDILFISANSNFEKVKNKNKLREKDIDYIIDIYVNRKEINEVSRNVSINEIKENEYNLNINRYIIKEGNEKYQDINEIVKRLREIEKEKKILLEKIGDQMQELHEYE